MFFIGPKFAHFTKGGDMHKSVNCDDAHYGGNIQIVTLLDYVGHTLTFELCQITRPSKQCKSLIDVLMLRICKNVIASK